MTSIYKQEPHLCMRKSETHHSNGLTKVNHASNGPTFDTGDEGASSAVEGAVVCMGIYKSICIHVHGPS